MVTSPPLAPATKPKAERIRTPNTSSLRIVPLGGVGEFGLNMTCYEVGDERIVVDAGAMFPEADMLGVDLVIPDVRWLKEEPEKLKAFVLTHGHEDHIGALPYILGQIQAPVYGTRLTLAFLRAKLEEHDLTGKIDLIELRYRESTRIGENFRITPISVTHSIPNSAALAIRTPGGTVLHSGDYKIDLSPVGGERFDFHSFSELGEEGVLALVADSTNADRPGSTRTERSVSENMAPIFAASPRAIFCATFSTSVHRLQQVMDLGAQYGRKIFVLGRSLERTFAIATEQGYLSPPERNLCAVRDLESVPPNERLILATGSQGEPLSVMSRLALGEHRQVQVEKDDTVILSARMIPANQRAIQHMVNHFCRRGARVYDENSADIHVSGHAYGEEMKTLINLVQPRFLVPVHGEVRQQNSHRDVALGMGFDPDSIFVLETGDVLELHPQNALVVGKVPTGRVLVDGKTVGETADVVLRDRQHLSEDGMLIAILNVDHKTGELLTDPEIVTRGFVYVDESEDLIAELSALVRDAFEACARETREESEILNAEIRRALRKHIRKNFDRFPLILPVIQEI
ncbi:ribonuclease J [Candidatus Sumerlaeota bacterium]|nr:ribonuclease J [Candidatus Sumerlaeota bacterium]